MSLIDTTKIIDTSIFLKSKLPKNMVSDNYYIENLQEKRDKDWEMRYNIVNIEEELTKQIKYTKCLPVYSGIDVAIRNVKDDKGKDLGTDWADIAFRDLKHPNKIGSRYRFGLDFEDLSNLTEEEKYYNKSIWICINKSPINAGNSCIIRRCNTSFALVGSEDNDRNNITECRFEPAILDNELKYINFYYNQVLVLPQAEWYLTTQYNYFTNSININDRMILGAIDENNRGNNQVFKVKAITKASSQKTFYNLENNNQIKDIPLIIIALDKDVVDEADDIKNRIANLSPMYLIEDSQPINEYYIDLEEPYDNIILLTQTSYYKPILYWNNNIKETNFNFSLHIENLDDSLINEYIEYNINDNIISIKNKKTYNQGNLIIKCSCLNPLDNSNIEKDFNIQLGGFY